MMVETGLQRFLVSPPKMAEGARLGLLMNQASIDSQFRYSCDVIQSAFPGQLKSLFSPQHGLWGQQQANMIESGDSVYAKLGLPVHSLYSQTRRPSPQSLSEIDCLIIDLQDVGTRVYTFIWTLLECLRACAESGTRMIVLDRPNPIGGMTCEGPSLTPDHLSFVGGHPMPMRHAMTIGEVALWLNATAGTPSGTPIGVDLEIVCMRNWDRSMFFAETQLPWVSPSPNLPTPNSAVVYPGQVLLEGCNLSEGRGTTQPFEICGAPFLDAEKFTTEVSDYGHEGVVLQPIEFVPTFDKWAGKNCRGMAVRMTDPNRVRSFRLAIAILNVAKCQAPQAFEWLPPPYEYERIKPPIDILYGSPRLRKRIDRTMPLSIDELDELCLTGPSDWQSITAPFHLYPD